MLKHFDQAFALPDELAATSAPVRDIGQPFTTATLALRRAWFDCAVLTCGNRFSSLPRDQYNRTGSKTYPWLVDEESGTVVMSKTCLRNTAFFLARQKIAADLGTYFRLPVPEGVLLRTPAEFWHCAYSPYSFLSPLAFDYTMQPDEPTVAASPYLPAMMIFDLFICHTDREVRNTVYDAAAIGEKPVDFIDYDDCLNPVHSYWSEMNELYIGHQWFAGAQDQSALLQAAIAGCKTSPLALGLLDELEAMHSSTLNEIIMRVPSELFADSDVEQQTLARRLDQRRLLVRPAIDRIISYAEFTGLIPRS